MNVYKVLIAMMFIINLAGCCTDGFKEIKTGEGTFAVPNCSAMIKYSGTSISVKGIDLTIFDVPVKIGEVTIEPKTIQQASEIVQILEHHRMTTCQMLPSYATISKEKFVMAIEAMQKDEAILSQFALVVASKDGSAIQKFVELYGPQVILVAKTEDKGKLPNKSLSTGGGLSKSLSTEEFQSKSFSTDTGSELTEVLSICV